MRCAKGTNLQLRVRKHNKTGKRGRGGRGGGGGVVERRKGDEVVVVDVGVAINQTLHSEFRSAEWGISTGGGELTHDREPPASVAQTNPIPALT